MSKMSEVDIDYSNLEKVLLDALISAATMEDNLFVNGLKESSEKLFQQVVLPLHQAVDYLRTGTEVDYV
jgi:hypothetical protein